MVDRVHVIQAFHTLLGRAPESDETIASHTHLASLPELIAVIMAGREFQERFAAGLATTNIEQLVGRTAATLAGQRYLAPAELAVTDQSGLRVLLTGECIFQYWGDVLCKDDPSLIVDFVLFNNHSALPEQAPAPFEDYDFQIVHIPLRSVMPEYGYLRLDIADLAAHETFFESCLDRLSLLIEGGLAWSQKIPSLVLSFFSPQQNPLGRLMPRDDLRNPVYFIERLNQELRRMMGTFPNTHVLDTDQVAAVYGRRFVQDDAVWVMSHGGMISDYDYAWDRNRLEPVGRVSDHYVNDVPGFIRMVWLEAVAMYRTIRSIDSVKMVCVDLDDTLWRGLIGEAEIIESWRFIEGWPLGMAEALLYLKKRGIILAIISKNDEAVVRARWAEVFGWNLSIEDFAIVKINWKPKAENMAEALSEANLLPRNVLFIDDNPVERASVSAAFPEIRTLGAPHYFWRRILLWSPETQVAAMSEESARRTEMIKAQVSREVERTHVSREDFLAALDLNVSLHMVRRHDDQRFSRALELINKTNQFNTTGVRWSFSDAETYFAKGGVWWTFEVADKYTRYGVVGVVAVDGATIDQFVMSCRVFGLEIEQAVLAGILPELARSEDQDFAGTLWGTSSNRPCRHIYEACGWVEDGAVWRGHTIPQVPAHVALSHANRPQMEASDAVSG